MKIKQYNIIFVSIFFIYILYFISTIFHSDFWGNILSPILALAACVIIFYRVIASKDRSERIRRIIWVFYGLASVFWAAADILWAIYDFFLGYDPEESILIIYIYLMTNIFMTIGLLIFITTLLRKWNGLQFVIDTIFISASMLFLFWIIFLDKSSVMINVIGNDGIPSAISIILDVSIFVGISTWYLSVRKGSIPFYLCTVSFGIMIFICTDLYYYYVYLNNVYTPNTVIDSIYIGSILMIALGASLEKQYLTSNTNQLVTDTGSNIGLKKKGLLLAICPILAIMAKEFVLIDLFIFFLIILVHQILSTYVQYSIKTEQLLKQEKELNLLLEDRIRRRTREISEKNKQLEQKNKDLNFLSNQDTVTNLYNRRYFIKALENAVNDCPPNKNIGLLFIDLDRFKTINDMYGHQIGDEVLIEISKRLDKIHGPNDILARLGGDEFVLGFSGKFSYKYLEQIAQTIIQLCTKAIEIEPYIFYVTASIGISIYPIDAIDAHSLMRNADIAMYQAKAQGKNRFVSFDSKFRDIVNRKNDIEILLNRADFSQEFQLFYQPQFRIGDKKLIGAEALLRWNNSPMGPISPAEFIPIAEEINMINEIGIWVLETAIQQTQIWTSAYSCDLKVGINVSPKQLDHKTFIRDLTEILKRHSVSPKNIDIEITESVAIEGEERIQQIDSLFQGLGVSISVDDFGTGYSSLSYLKFFPFERIKIAKPLIDAIATDDYDLQIVKAVILLAKSIGMKTIAEGVETQEQYNILDELGCDEIQGYLLGKPVPADLFKKLYLS